MGDYERVLRGTRSQVFAAAYRGVIARHHEMGRVDIRRASFVFFTLPTPWCKAYRVTVTVHAVDADRTGIFIETNDQDFYGGTIFDFGTGKRIAERVFRDAEAAWAQPLDAFGRHGWYRDPVGRYTGRYWDGAQWSPWVWRRDQLSLDAPESAKLVARRTEFVPGIPCVWIQRERRKWLPPPIVAVRALRGWRGRLVVVAKNIAVFTLALLVGVAGVWYLSTH